jgi:hypothetical protein
MKNNKEKLERPEFPPIEYRSEPSIMGASPIGIVFLFVCWFIFILLI